MHNHWAPTCALSAPLDLPGQGTPGPWYSLSGLNTSPISSCRVTLVAPWSARRMEPGPWWASCPGAAAGVARSLQACTPGSPSLFPGFSKFWRPTEPLPRPSPHVCKTQIKLLASSLLCLRRGGRMAAFTEVPSGAQSGESWQIPSPIPFFTEMGEMRPKFTHRMVRARSRTAGPQSPHLTWAARHTPDCRKGDH